MKESYGTLSQTVNALRVEGYIMDFNILQERIICHQPNAELSGDDFLLIKFIL